MTKFPPSLGLCLAVVAVLLLLPSPARGAGPAPSPTPEAKSDALHLDGNYVLTLYSPVDQKNGPDLAIIVALSAFDPAQDPDELRRGKQLPAPRPFPRDDPPAKGRPFPAQLLPEKSGATATSGLLLRPGEPVQMIKNGDQYYNLRLERYNTPAPR